MHIYSIHIKNFLSIGEANITFDSKGIALIEGVNQDSPSSISNGSGKSSILEALCYVFYGQTKRGLSSDEVINNTISQDCEVKIFFDDYKIIRRRGWSKGDSNQLILERYDTDAEVWLDLTKGTMKDTQKAILDIIKMSFMVFQKIVCFGQGDIKPFGSLSDSELKSVFEQSLNLDFLTDYKNQISLIINNKNKLIETLDQEKEYLSSKIESEKNMLEQLAIKHKQEDKDKQHRLDKIKKTIDGFNKQIADYKNLADKRPELDSKLLLNSIAIRAKIDNLKALQDKLEASIDNVKKDAYTQRSNSNAKNKELDTLSKDLKEAEKKIENPCYACGRPFKKEDINTLIEATQKRIEDLKPIADTEVENYNKIAQKLNELQTKRSKLLAAIKTEEENFNKAIDIERQIEQAENAQDNINKIKEYIADEEKNYKDIEAKENSFAELITNKKKDIKTIETDIANKELEISNKKKDKYDYELLMSIFNNGGLKSYIFDNITPELNKLIDKYIKILDDIDIEISTVKKLKSGKLADKFSIEVNNLHGADNYKGNSGGELQKINLAISLGFNSVIRKMHFGNINVCFMDEPFESLDEGSAEKVIELCTTFKDVDNLFLITHNPNVKELVTQTLTVTKESGISKIH